MIFKLYFLIIVCTALVLCRSDNQRDLISGRIEDHHSSAEIRRETKRDEENAKRLAEDLNQPPIAFEASEEGINKETVRLTKHINKRFDAETEAKNKCCG